MAAAATRQELRQWWWGHGVRFRAIGASCFTTLLILALVLTTQSPAPDTAVNNPLLSNRHIFNTVRSPPQPLVVSLTRPETHAHTVKSPVRQLVSSREVSNVVNLTLLQNATETGAVCLDGSPPGYHLQRGHGSGSSSWLLHLEGGGWCSTLESCLFRRGAAIGSSQHMESQDKFYGILSPYPSENPDFHNWNKVKIRYCDAASFSGFVEGEVQNGTKLFFRGKRIWEAVMDELLLQGLANAKQAFLTGCSAGGLATFIHCDSFRALLPKVATVKCLADAAFFLNETSRNIEMPGSICRKDVSGNNSVEAYLNRVVRLQGISENLQQDCISKMEPTKCFFPREILRNIDTPIFILNSAYDFWQIQNVLAPETSDPQGYWQSCKYSIHSCDSNQIELLQRFRTAMLSALGGFQNKNKNGGMLITSCFDHCQSITFSWHSPRSPRVNNKTIAEAVGDWYFERRPVKEVDCPFPCNPTCHHMDFSKPIS